MVIDTSLEILEAASNMEMIILLFCEKTRDIHYIAANLPGIEYSYEDHAEQWSLYSVDCTAEWKH